ncbi:cytochrome c [Oxalobacteraceae bacterium OM1]|nr:cytochrome c [Oxalobacteraceae bacterium OM1]
MAIYASTSRTAGLALVLLLPLSSALADTAFSRIERGRYLVAAGDCAACHTADGGKPFAGGRAIPTPFGKIYSTNITPDKATGIGSWSDQDFYRAMHEGIRRDGDHLYPAFPYPWFTKLTPDDVGAIKTYLNTLTPVRQQTPQPELPWPMSWRGSVAAWNRLFFHEGTFQPQAGKSEAWNRGAYLVQGAGHCAACHTAKNALGGTDQDRRLAGGDAGEHWYAPALTSNLQSGLGKWTEQDIVAYLKTGSTGKTAAAGPMAEVIKNSTQYLSDSDLHAIAVYLKDLPGEPVENDQRAANASAKAISHGGGLYIDNCAGCHMQNGGGQPNVFPSLRASSLVQSQKPDSLIRVILGGARKPVTPARATGLAMPAFDTKLSDAEVADLVSFIRNAWGNHAPPTDADTVAAVRKAVGKPGG